ncbi:retrotransposon protein, putative, ty1-copia subclass [Tanacetum coccineum]
MDGNVHTFKDRLLAKGFTQTYIVDYGENFSLVADIRAIRILLAIAAFYDYEIWKLDVKTSFLNGHLREDVYMVHHEGFVDLKHPSKVCKLQRFIYGLKQSSRSWNKRFDEEIKKIGNNVTMLQDVKSWLCKCFSMKDLGEAAYILRIKIIRDRSKRLISLSHSDYFDKILKKFKMENSKRGSTPMQEKPNYRESQGAQTPSKVKHMVLVYGVKPKSELKVTCYADAGFQTDKDDTKSQSGYIFMLNGRGVGWNSAKQSTTAMSSIKVEYSADTEASMEAVWMRKFIDGLGDVMPSNRRPMEMLCDNAPSIAIANDTAIMRGDPLTKPMPYNKHFEYSMGIGVCPASSLM